MPDDREEAKAVLVVLKTLNALPPMTLDELKAKALELMHTASGGPINAEDGSIFCDLVIESLKLSRRILRGVDSVQP